MSDPTPDPAALWDRKFYDSADYIFPDGATHIMAYADGKYGPTGSNPPPTDLRDRYPFIHYITVLGGSQAWHPQFADYELFNPVYDQPGQLRAWVEARLARDLRAVPYCDRFDLRRLHDELGTSLFTNPNVSFWIPTLDGRQWTALELAQNIGQKWGVYIPASRIWGNQYAGETSGSGGPWDTSNLFGTWN